MKRAIRFGVDRTERGDKLQCSADIISISEFYVNSLKAEYGRTQVRLAGIACRVDKMIVFINWSTCELASGILFPHITAYLLDEVGTAWVNVDVVILHELYAVHDGILTLAAWSNAIHAILISEFRNIFWGSAVSNNLLLREAHFIYCLINLPIRHVFAVKLAESINLTI